MTHHIVFNSGSDPFVPAVADGDKVCLFTTHADDEPGFIRNSIAANIAAEGLRPADAAMDILALGLAVYSADMFVRRSTGYDSWTRHFRLHLAVARPDAWETEADLVAEMLSFLTGDHWELSFRLRVPTTTENAPPPKEVSQPDMVSLFSGGLDSFIGAIDLLEAGHLVSLVGHHGAGTTNQAQENAFGIISREFGDKSRWLRFYVQPPSPTVGEPEKTTRSRSILFLALGTIVASGYEKPIPLYVPENGLISLNPPLTDSRMGSLSTRTTHPHFLELYRRLLAALETGIDLQTPYSFKTKGEMICGAVSSKGFRAGVHKTVSCSHPDVGRYQGASPGQHCGYCVPCIIRRASLRVAGLDDPERYLANILTKRPSHTSGTGRDLRAFEMAIAEFNAEDGVRSLFEVLSTGPIPPDRIAEYVGVYCRGMLEIKSLLQPLV